PGGPAAPYALVGEGAAGGGRFGGRGAGDPDPGGPLVRGHRGRAAPGGGGIASRNGSHARPPGRASSRTGFVVWGWANRSLQAKSPMPPSRRARRAPYFTSPARGWPRAAICTRIWWWRPVSGRTPTRARVLPARSVR